MKRLYRILFVILVLALTQAIYAQTPPPPDGGGGPGTTTDILPINFIIYPFMILGAYLGYVFIKKAK